MSNHHTTYIVLQTLVPHRSRDSARGHAFVVNVVDTPQGGPLLAALDEVRTQTFRVTVILDRIYLE